MKIISEYPKITDTTYRLILLLSFMIFFAPGNEISGRKVKTTHKIEKKNDITKGSKMGSGSKRADNGKTLPVDNDSVMFDPKNISFSGYDKTASSSKESFLITNKNTQAIEAVEVSITYLDMKGRMLHARNIRVSCYVPAGETRKADIDSWDTQKTYYYHLGPKPKKVATPYKVKITPHRLFFEQTEE